MSRLLAQRGFLSVAATTTLSSAGSFTTFDSGSATNTTLSNSDLTATHSNSTLGGVKGVAFKNSGKFYFEITVGTVVANMAIGIATTGATYTNVVTNGTNCGVLYSTGAFWSNGGNSGLTIGGGFTTNDRLDFAVDLDGEEVWVRKNSGDWFGAVIGSQNPADGTGGASISNFSGTTMAPVIGWPAASGGVVTANFGASAFVGTPPNGYSGWSA